MVRLWSMFDGDQFDGRRRRRCRLGGILAEKPVHPNRRLPCLMESHEHAFMMAGKLAELCRSFGVGLVCKSSFDKANFAVRQEYGFRVLTTSTQNCDQGCYAQLAVGEVDDQD